MPRVIYGWRAGSRIGLDAQAVGQTIERLTKRHNGVLEPGHIVEAARDESSPMHPHFIWDDAEAAERYREDQARDLIRSLTVDISRSNVEPPKPIRAFVNVETGGERGYVSTATAMSSEDLRKQVIARAFGELEAWRARYAELTELGRIFSAIDETQGLLNP